MAKSSLPFGYSADTEFETHFSWKQSDDGYKGVVAKYQDIINEMENATDVANSVMSEYPSHNVNDHVYQYGDKLRIHTYKAWDKAIDDDAFLRVVWDSKNSTYRIWLVVDDKILVDNGTALFI